MGLSIYLEEDNETIYSCNITHNLGLMANKAGIYDILWRPEEIGIKKAKDIINPLYEGLIELQIRPNYYSKFNSPNGWGIYRDFIPFLRNYLIACRGSLNANISVWR